MNESNCSDEKLFALNDMDAQETYTKVRSSVITAQSRIYSAVNTAMVQVYWGDRRADLHCLR